MSEMSFIEDAMRTLSLMRKTEKSMRCQSDPYGNVVHLQ